MKKILSLFLIFIMLSGGAVYAAPLYTDESTSIITSGVTQKSICRFYGDYALSINCITADLTNKYLGFELLKNDGGSDKLDTVMNLASKEENTVAAINGDFFSHYKNDQNFSLGIEIKDGTLLQSHINSNMAAGFFEENALTLSYLDLKGTVTSPDGTEMPVAHINKPTDYYGALLIYTPQFNGGVSPFLPEGITAVTVEEAVVTAKGISLGGVIPIPENGYIMVIDDNMTPFLEYKFSPGDAVEFSLSATPEIEGVDTAFGGGTLLLKDGKKTEITHNVTGNNPRSVIGTNGDGTMIYMITVDGRQSESRGVTLDVLSDICLELGCVNAINLDGGGSTALVGKNVEDGKLQYINSPTEKRKVINALAITSDATPDKAVGFKAKSEKSIVADGETVKLTAIPYDKNYNTPISCTTTPRWVVSKGGGYVKNDIFYANGEGNAVIDLYFGSKKTDTLTIRVTKASFGEEGDPLRKDEEGGFSFSVFASGEIDTLYDRLVYMKAADTLSAYGGCAVVGGNIPQDISMDSSPLTAKKWGEADFEEFKVLSLETAGSVISRGPQWQKLKESLLGAKQENIIILLDSEPRFAANIDKEFFDKLLIEASENKNVFIVYNGEENSCRMENGIRYISIEDTDSEKSLLEKTEDISILSFNITKDSISYRFKKLYDKAPEKPNTDINSGIVIE